MEQEFESCFEIEQLAKKISDGIYKVRINNKQLHYPEKPSDKKATDAAYALCLKWNQNEASRRFVKTLIRAFYNIEWTNKVDEFEPDEKPFCCIIHTPLISKNKFKEILVRFKKLKNMLNMQENNQRHAQMIDSVADWIDDIKQDKNFTNPHFGYYSDKFKFYICVDTYYGLKAFCTWAQQYGVKEITGFIDKAYKKESKRIAKASFNALGGSPDLQKLAAMRQKIHRQNKQKLLKERQVKK